MTITSGERHELHTKLTEVLGGPQANTLMEHLPPVGWADVATKRDLDSMRTGLSAELRGEISELGTDLRREISQLGTELRTEIGELGHQLQMERIERRSETDRLMTRVMREQRLFLAAMILAMSTLLTISYVLG